jgi:Ca-activated chloride channel family protein
MAAVTLSACAPPREAIDGTAAYKAKNYHRAATLLAQVARDDHSPGALYNYGTALIAIDSTASAAELLDRAAEKTDQETQYRARFNGGLAHLLPGLKASRDSAADDLKQALAHYKRVLIQRPADADAKWNYELALEKQKKGGGGGGGAQQEPKPQPTLAQRQAEQILGSAQREERDVQSKKQKQSRQEPPPGGKDW